MQSMTFRSPLGAEVTFENAPPYVGWKYDGLGIPDSVALTDRAPGQDGYTAYSILMESRRIILTGHVHGKNGVGHMYEERKKLMQALNPSFGLGELIYRNDHGRWKIPAFCAGTPSIQKIRNFHTLEIIFECPSPYFLSKYPSIINLAYIAGDLEFPLVTPGYFGDMGYEAIIDNDSDVYLPLFLEVEGGSINPTITNKTTGASFTIIRTMSRHEKLYISTDLERPYVQLGVVDEATNEEIRQNAWSYLNRDYDLIQLVPGRNVLTFHSDDETKDVKITITYQKRYVGV